MGSPDLEWQQFDIPSGRSVRRLLIGPDGTRYAATLNGLLRSDREGGPWQATPLANVWVEALLLVGSKLYAGTEGSGVAATPDGGDTWRAVNKGLSDLQLRAFAAWKGAVFAGTAGGGAFRLSRDGTEWAPVNEGLGSTYWSVTP